MRLNSRQQQILNLLRGGAYLEVKELAHTLAVDASTIRRDLQRLTALGHIERLHGGAILRNQTGIHTSSRIPADGEHLAIANAARRMIKHGDSICLGSGPISAHLTLSLLDLQDLTVITNDLRSAMTLSQNKTTSVFIPGGQLQESPSQIVSGPLAQTQVAEHVAKWSFIEIEGIHPYSGFTTSAPWQAGVNRALLQTGKRRCVLAHSGAFGRRCVGFIANISTADLIMTDELLGDYDLPAFGGKVVRVAIKNEDTW